VSDSYVHEIGRLTDPDGRQLVVSVDHDTVAIGNSSEVAYYLGSIEAEEFAQLLIAACWQAARNNARMTAPALPAHDQREAVHAGMAAEGHDCRDIVFGGGA
jgi:hypothetical protein